MTIMMAAKQNDEIQAHGWFIDRFRCEDTRPSATSTVALVWGLVLHWYGDKDKLRYALCC